MKVTLCSHDRVHLPQMCSMNTEAMNTKLMTRTGTGPLKISVVTDYFMNRGRGHKTKECRRGAGDDMKWKNISIKSTNSP